MNNSTRIAMVFLFLLFGVQQSLVLHAQKEAELPPEVVYISPLPGSEQHNPECNIIIRFKEKINPEKFRASHISLVSSEKQKIEFDLKYYLNENTLILRPRQKFDIGEQISLILSSDLLTFPLDLQFKIRDEKLKDYKTPTKETKINIAETFHTKDDNLPDDFPEVQISNNNNPSAAHSFLGIRTKEAGKKTYLTILDTTGFPIFYRKFHNATADFKVQKNGYLSFYLAINNRFIEMDSAYKTRRILRSGNGYYTDMHELLVLLNDDYWVMGLDPQIVDMSQLVPGGNPNANVTGYVVQKIKSDGEVIFQWRTLDHIPILDTDTNFVNLTGSIIDYVHCNALSLDADGNILLCSRHTNEITKINTMTGDIVWRWGGLANEFTFIEDPRGFKGQHSIRFNGGNSYTLFNNANFLTPEYSCGMEYQLDQSNLTATLINEFTSGNPLIYSDAMGHMQRMSNGNTVCGWAGNENLIVMTEYDTSGNKVFEITNPDSSMISYRAFKFEWETNMFLFDKDSLHFGEEILIGDSVEQVLQITNNYGKATIINYHHLNDSCFELVTNLPQVFQVDETKEFSIRFKPKEEKQYVDVISFYYQDDSSRIAKQIKVSGGGLLTKTSGQITAEQAFSIYPNPAKEYFLIRSNIETNSQIEIYNVLGEQIEIYEQKDQILKINTQEWERGIYIIRIKHRGSFYTKKIILK